MTESPAIILSDCGAGDTAPKISTLLEFFGLASRLVTVDALFSVLAESTGEPVRILGSCKYFLQLANKLASDPESRRLWASRVHSAFCHVENGGNSLAALITALPTGSGLRLVTADESGQSWTVSQKSNDITGPMADLQVEIVLGKGVPLQLIQPLTPQAEAIISHPAGAAFLRLKFYGVPLLLTTSDIIDINAPLPSRDFDIRPHFLAAVPVVLYVKWAFAHVCWQPPESTACLVIDDPLLRPRYGHLNYDHLLGLMERLNFSTSIAFIPWNWNRSSRKTVKLFREHPSRFSLSIHGCDHTAGEYGSGNRERLAWKSHRSIQRMTRHCRQTGLPHDNVMVFPQGVFSGAAMAALKQGDFIGTVNSEVISAETPARPVTIADYWNVAVMNYSDFPIFTRRYPWAGVENFAFDILLGKPCIVVIHHNDCHDGYQCLTECIGRLNRLNTRLRWTNLAEVIHRGFRQRETSPGVLEVEIYGSEARIENRSGRKKFFRFQKREAAPETIREIRIAGKSVKWRSAENRIFFEAELNAGETESVEVRFKEIPVDDIRGEGLYYEAKVRVRRYLCEVRDNYLMKKFFSK